MLQFVTKQRELLKLEHDADMQQSAELLLNRSHSELQASGVVILKVSLTELSTERPQLSAVRRDWHTGTDSEVTVRLGVTVHAQLVPRPGPGPAAV